MRITRRRFVGQAAAASAVLAAGGRQRAHAELGTSLREAGAAHGLLVGCAVAERRWKTDPAYVALVREQAGIVVAENAFKFGSLRPSQTTFAFADADELAAFAGENGMKLRGHNFVWHRQLPPWFAGYVTRANAEQVLVEHIEHVGGRYAGRIHSWDVVNEAVFLDDGLPGGLRNSPWQKVLAGEGFGAQGETVPKYVEVAFRTARRVDPKALLCYNEYGIEAEDEASAKKRAAVMQLLRAIQAKGIPLDALGVQSHIAAGSGAVYGAGLKAMIAEAGALGLKVLVTEMDVNDRALGPDVAVRDLAVAQAYEGYLKTVVADPAVIAVLTWGLTDRYTWLNGEDARPDKLPERALPFDAQLRAKPAVEGMRCALAVRA